MSGSNPRRVYKRPNDRHFIARVTLSSAAKEVNTVIEPWVDVDADVSMINLGHAACVGNRCIVNGRTYQVKTNGTLFPIDGPGFRVLDRGAYKALQAYNAYGHTAGSSNFLQRSNISRQAQAIGLLAWRAGQRGRR